MTTIFSIETSADETAAAVTSVRRVLSNVVYSQILLHKKWGGIFPSVAKRAHEERIDLVINETILKYHKNFLSNELVSSVLGERTLVPRSSSESEGSYRRSLTQTSIPENFSDIFSNKIDFIAVTQGPGLAVALEVGIQKAKELAKKYNKKVIAVNHLEGHIYSSFVQNSAGNPSHEFRFPYLALIISGGHTEIVRFEDHVKYKVLGSTRDDAAGEALDKAAKMLGLGYPGGPVIERLAKEADNKEFHRFPRPMIGSNNLDFSFSGLKTSLLYYLQTIPEHERKSYLKQVASSYQNAVFDTLIRKTKRAIIQTGIPRVVVGGGVSANFYLRKLLRHLLKEHKGEVYFPSFPYLTGDNAAMIGVAAYYKAKKGIFYPDLEMLDRIPRMILGEEVKLKI